MASPFVSHAMLNVCYVTKQKVSRSFVFLSQIFYSDSDFVSFFGNFTMRTQVTLRDIHFHGLTSLHLPTS